MRIAEAFDYLNGFFKGLNRREQYFVSIAGIALILFIIFQFIVLPVVETKKRLDRKLVDEAVVLQDMRALQKEFDRLREKTAIVEVDERGEKFRLFSFLDRLAGQAGVKDSITHMRPSTSEAAEGGLLVSVVEVKLETVDLQDLVSYLYRIETSDKMVFVQRLSISRNEGEKTGVDAVMQVETVKG